MAKHTNSVRFLVKEGQQEAFENLFREPRDWNGLMLHVLAKTGERSYISYALWETEDAMVDTRPQMISLLDTGRDMLEELSPELGVTDPVSGLVVVEHS